MPNYYDDGPNAAGILQNFLSQYQQGKRDRREEDRDISERALREKLARAEMLQKGFRQGEGGDYEMTPEALEDQGLDREYKRSQIAKNLAEAKGGGNPLKQTLDAINLKLKQDELDKIENAKTPAGRLEKLGADGKAKVGAIATTLQSIQDYKTSFNEGKRKSLVSTDTPLIGKFVEDNTVDILTRKLSDDIGRLRSGGAISVDEEKRFLGMLPRSSKLEGDVNAKEKLGLLEKEMQARLNAYGLKDSELGEAGFSYSPVALKESGAPKGGLLSNKAQAGTKKSLDQMSDAELEAYENQLLGKGKK